MCERYVLKLKEVRCYKRTVHPCLVQSECQCVVDEVISGTKDGCVTYPLRESLYYISISSFSLFKISQSCMCSGFRLRCMCSDF